MSESHNSAAEVVNAVSDDVFVFPASFAQQRLWFLDKLEPGQGYNVPVALRLTGDLRPELLERSIAALISRHEVLRTTFSEDETGGPIQLVAARQDFSLPITDLVSCSPASREDEARRLVIEQALLPFDLTKGPLFRVTLFRLDKADYVLSFAFHHSIVDGASMGVLLRELSALYEAFDKGQPSPLNDLAIQYGDYATWQKESLQGEKLDTLLAYWKTALQGAPPVLDLPTDFVRPPKQTFSGAHESLVLPKSIEQGLLELSKKEAATLFMTLLASFSLLLARYSGQEDVVVGTPISGRTRSELEGLIGFFVNTLPLRTDLSGNPSFRKLLGRVRETALQGYAHQDLPFEKLVEELNPERNLSHNPIMQVMFTFDSAAPRPKAQMSNVAIASFRGAEGMSTKFDLSLNALQNQDGLTVGFTYNVDLFAPSTVKRMLRHFCALLEGIAVDADKPIADLNLLSDSEREQVLHHWNPSQDYPVDVCIHRRFEQQVKRAPASIAVTVEGQSLSYGELNARSNQLARYLMRLGVGPEVLVGLCVERSLDMVVALLAIVKAGGAYLPLDPRYPKDRLAFMVEDAKPAVVLTQSELRDSVPGTASRVFLLNADWEEVAGEDRSDVESAVGPENLAYVIYTSGSTGRPKGCQVTHRNVVRLFDATHDWYRFDNHDVWTMFHSYAFDFSVWEMWGALIFGGRLVIVPYLVSRSPEDFYRLLITEAVTVLNQTPSSFRQLMQIEEKLGTSADLALRYVVFGGEALDLASLGPWFERHGDRAPQLVNMYGITETTVHVTYRPLTLADTAAGSVIGCPIPDLQVYLLDSRKRPVPVGVPGEIYVGGSGVARGYLNRPELNSERFISDPFRPGAGHFLYKSGDLARRLANGDLQYLGRIDQQVKIRGFRIELGEIESLLAQHPAVQQAVVIVREDTPGDKRLVGYVVSEPGQSVSTTEIRAYLRQALPDYMLPAALVELDTLPLTPNGKVDRKVLPVPEYGAAEAEGTFAAPRSPAEEIIAGIWEHVLKGGRHVSIRDNFFELGGHSLLAMQVVSRISKALNVELPLSALFETPTVAGLAEKARSLETGMEAAHALPLVPIPRTQPLQLSFAQQRLWFLDRLEPNNALYNVPTILRLKGALDFGALRRALNRVVARHESLRTWFTTTAGSPVQTITPSLELQLEITSVMTFAERIRETETRRLIQAEVNRPFDLAMGPLVRAMVVKISDNDHVLVINTHHIISDGWSLGVLRQELAEFYEEEEQGTAREVPPLPLQYADYAAWQRQLLSGEVMQSQLKYWRQKLQGAPASLELPTDRPRPAEQSFRGASYGFEISKTVMEQLQALGRQEGATLFMSLLAVFNILLARYTGQDDIVVGSPIAGRSRSELESLVGFFVNTLVLRTIVDGKESFRQLLAKVRETAMGAYAHQDVPFERLVEELKPERDLSRNPLFQVMFTAHNASSSRRTMGSLEIGGMPTAGTSSKFDLTLTASERESGLRALFEYNTDLFDLATIERLAQHFEILVEEVVKDPDQSVSVLPLMTESEYTQILTDWNANSCDYPRDRCVNELVAQQAAKTPDAVAIEKNGQQVSYAQLEAQATQLAGYLHEQGVGPETPVGMYVNRSTEMLVALLAVWKAGGAYVPLDPAYPAERIRFIVQDADVQIVLTESALVSSLREGSADLKVIEVDSVLAQSTPTTTRLQLLSQPKNLAYVLYTSGSTGKPKGVQITHANLVNFLTSMQREPGFTSRDSLLAVTTLSFDIAGLELYLPLISGGRILLASRDEASDGRVLQGIIERHRPTVMQATPATWRMLIEAGWKGLPELKVLCGGEALPSDLAEQLLPRCGELWNMYGPTETTVWSSIYRVHQKDSNAPIGRPIANTTFYILDAAQQPVPIGVAGELYIGGEGVARGYFRRPELTAEKFILDTFSERKGARLYRTGDLARYLPDGNVQYLGRTDFQVKVRGFRIELGEIESLLAQNPAVQQSVVAAREDSPGNKRLVAYIVPKSGAHLSIGDARAFLKQNLPDYMLPAALVELEALPLTPNGKVDRKALPVPDQPVATGEAVLPRDSFEEKLLAIWKNILQNPGMGVTDDFFDLGGHSLMAAQLVSEMEKCFGRKIPLAALFRGATVAEMAKLLREGSESTADPMVMRIQAGRSAPFFAVVEPGMEAIGYVKLAQAMGPDQSFYKLQSHRVIKPDTPITLVETAAIAREYVQALRSVQPNGPYYLGGMCVGTHIGEQMVLQLEAEGERVALFAVFDTWVRQNSQVRWKWWVHYYRQRLRGWMRVRRQRKLKMIREAMKKKLQRVATLSKPVETSWSKLYWPGKDFQTPRFQAPVALFKRPKQPFYYMKDEAMGWGERSQGGVHIYRIDFPHRMLREPYVHELASRLLECLAQESSRPVEKLQVWPRVSEHQSSAADLKV